MSNGSARKAIVGRSVGPSDVGRLRPAIPRNTVIGRLLPIPILLVAPAFAQPLIINRQAIDFGTVGLISVHRETLTVTNRSDRPIRFGLTDSNCTCLDSELADGDLPPNGSTEWTIALKTCDYTGEVRRSVWVETDQPDQPQLQLPVRYRVVPELYAEPSFFALGLIGGAAVERVVEVGSCGTGRTIVRSAYSDNALVDVEIVNGTISRERPARIRISVPGMPQSRFRANVWVESDSASMPRLKIPVFGESIQGLSCDRPEVEFEQMRYGVPLSQTVRFSRKPFVSVGGIRASNDSVSIQKVERGDGEILITVAPNKRLPMGTFDGFLILEVNASGKSRKLKLPYRGRVIPEARQQHPIASAPECCAPSMP